MEKKKHSKYEEVIIKSILANELFEKNFLNQEQRENMNWLEEVNKIYNSKDFDGDYIISNFAVNTIYDILSQRKYHNFLSEDLEIDNNAEKKYMTIDEEINNEENKKNKKNNNNLNENENEEIKEKDNLELDFNENIEDN